MASATGAGAADAGAAVATTADGGTGPRHITLSQSRRTSNWLVASTIVRPLRKTRRHSLNNLRATSGSCFCCCYY